MAQLFGVGIPAISKHLKNIFEEEELQKEVVVSKMEITTRHGAIEGKTQTSSVDFITLMRLLLLVIALIQRELQSFANGQRKF